MSEQYPSSTQPIPTAGLRLSHFADLVRFAQIVYDPTGGLSGRSIEVDWQDVGLSDEVVDNLTALGHSYQYALPHIAPDVIWEQLTPATRAWFIANRSRLAELEETFMARDED